MERRDVLKAGLAAVLAGCSTQPDVSQKKSPAPDSVNKLDPAADSLRRFLAELKEQGVAALAPVVSDDERKQVIELNQQLAKVNSQDPRSTTDYRLDGRSVKADGTKVEAVVRRYCGGGEYTFRVDPQMKKTYYAYQNRSEPLPFAGAIATDLPPSLGELAQVLRDPTRLRKAMAGMEVFVVLAGIAGHPDRLEAVEVEERSKNEPIQQAVYSIVGLEKPIPVEVILSKDRSMIEKIVKIDNGSPLAWLKERIKSLAQPDE
jgi:hypothetical protein